MVEIAEIFEIIMVVCFGLSWPLNVVKSWRVRTTKGKSLMFLLFILIGYIFGITSKFINPNFNFATKWYVVFFYILNFVMVAADVILYVRNYLIDKKNGVL
mgnify:CR=1 FL=1